MSEKDWTKEDERDPFARFRKKDPRELYGALDRHTASHWCYANVHNLTIETWAKTGYHREFNLRIRIRPMTEQEVILTKVRDHSREAVLRAFGVFLAESDSCTLTTEYSSSRPRPSPKIPWWKRIFHRN